MKHPVVRVVLLSIGFLCVGIGVVALAVPIVPTMPFLLIAAACFARSSPRFYNWLIHHPWFGAFIRNYQEKGGITRRQKIITLATFWPAVAISGFFAPAPLWVRVTMGVGAVVVTICLVMMKTVPPEKKP